jgi:hypothetical protein
MSSQAPMSNKADAAKLGVSLFVRSEQQYLLNFILNAARQPSESSLSV